MEGLSAVGAGENHESSTDSPIGLRAYLEQFLMEDLPPDESVAGHTPPDPHSSSVDTSNYTAATAAGQGQPVLDAHTEWDWREWISGPVLSQIQVAPYSAGDPTSTFTGAGTEEMMQSGSGNVLPAHTPSAAAAAVDGFAPVLNAGFTHPQPDNTSCSASTAAADMGSSSPLDLEVYYGAGLSQSGGGGFRALMEELVPGSSKRKKLGCGSSSQRSTPPEFNLVELQAGFVQMDPTSADITPPIGSSDAQIIDFLKREGRSVPDDKEVNLSLSMQDQICPKDFRKYVTTVDMMPDQKTHLGYWKEKQVVWGYGGVVWMQSNGFKRTFQFHMYDGTKTNWFMDEYIPMDFWGIDGYMERLRFRVVHTMAAKISDPGEPTSSEVKIKNKSAATKKHRMRGPENMVISDESLACQHIIKAYDRHPELDRSNPTVVKGESPAWQHFIKIYDRHPELEGAKVVYAVCCHCEGVLKAGIENGTKSLLTHRDRTCPVRNKKQQPSTSSYQQNFQTHTMDQRKLLYPRLKPACQQQQE